MDIHKFVGEGSPDLQSLLFTERVPHVLSRDRRYAVLISLWVGSVWAAMCAVGVIVTLLRRRSGRRWIAAAAGLAGLVMVFAVERSIGIDARPADTAAAVYVEVRNHSGDTLSIVSTDGPIKKLRSGGRTFIRADVHASPDELGRFCLPSRSSVVVGPRVRFELVDCYGRGRNVVTWDGSEAYSDPDGAPLLLDSRLARVTAGLIVGAVAIAVGWLADRRRACSTRPIPSVAA